MTSHRPLLAAIALAVLAACNSGATDGFERLADGSYLHATPYQGGPLVEGSRCWKRGQGYDCLALRRFDAPAFLVTRYTTGSLGTTPRTGQRFGCLFEPTGEEWFRQLIARQAITAQTDAMLVRSVPRIGDKGEWSRAEAVALLRDNGAPATDFVDCRAIHEVIVTSGTKGLLERDLDVSHLFS